MKKLYLWIFAISFPVICYMLFFFANDPHRYFSGDASDNTLMGKMIDFKNHSYDAILLGDSRIDNMDVKELNQGSTFSYKNMAYGGCMSREMISLFWWCIEHQNTNIKSVIIVTGFYNMNTLLQQDRVSSTEKIINNPISYAFCLENLKACLHNLKIKQKNIRKVNAASISDDVQKASNFKMSRDEMTTYLKNYTYDQSVLNDFVEIGNYCAAHDILLKIVLPPWWEDFYGELIRYDLLDILDEYKQTISLSVPIWDLEYKECPLNSNYDDFSDYSHFHGQTQEYFYNVIINNDSTYTRLWKEGRILK